MIDRPPPRALSRARLLAELKQSLDRARASARVLAADPGYEFEVGLLLIELDRISAEVEQIRLGRVRRDANGGGGDGPPLHWLGPQG